MNKSFHPSINHPSLTKTGRTLHAAVFGGSVLALVLAVAPAAHAQTYSNWSAPTNLGPVINSGFNDSGPAISKNSLSLYFTSNRPGGVGGIDMYVSQRASVDDPWGSPVNLGPTVNSTGNDGNPAFSRDGHYMFFQSDRAGAAGVATDVYFSWREHTHDDFGWRAPVLLGAPINTTALDSGPSYFENDEGPAPQLYFSSSRLGTLDIYMSEALPDGSFGAAVLVAELNSTSADARPSIRRDGLEIFFQSDRIGSVGFDLWVATRGSTFDAWSTPVNLGAAINSAFNDQFAYVSSDHETLFFGSDRPGGSGALDLYISTRTKLHGRSGK
jgi:hypothetical protein